MGFIYIYILIVLIVTMPALILFIQKRYFKSEKTMDESMNKSIDDPYFEGFINYNRSSIIDNLTFYKKIDVVGTKYRSFDEIRHYKNLKIGDELTMIHEPKNPYDNNAIKVVHQNYHIGYISKKENISVLKYLNSDNKYILKVVRIMNNDTYILPYIEFMLCEKHKK